MSLLVVCSRSFSCALSFLTQSDSEIMHSSAYKNAIPFKGKRVLIIGSGLSSPIVLLSLRAYSSLWWDLIDQATLQQSKLLTW